MPNALADEKSPYLRQHADNPVAWLPWGEPAFARARAEQKPIFLSIGYSTCHWCHVMAHESFENPAIAVLLNEHFIPIKVDREERPDVDRVYMAYVQAMTGHGGWPLSAWLTPDLKPFYGGTYFPPEDRAGRTGFPSLLEAIARIWRENPARLTEEAERALGTLREHYDGRNSAGESAGHDAPALADAASRAYGGAFEYFHEAFDATHGGFGGAPKFPRASNLNLLFRIAALQGPSSGIGAEAIKLATSTLRAMAAGGIHDHVGGGYHRYSVDQAWFLPHFEKMLYDQAQIAVNFLEAKQATGDERFAWMARDIFDYVLRDLRSPAGGFYTAEDADSPTTPSKAGAAPGAPDQRPAHAEGAFYVWTAEELRAAAGEDFELLATHFGVETGGNVRPEFDPHGDFRGRNLLAQKHPLGETARRAGLTAEQASDRLGSALARLRTVRARRPRPHRDEKILTSNNGLMISALARAHVLLDTDGESPAGYLPAAIQAAEFVERELHDPARGVLFRTWCDGRGATEGFAEDYAYLIQGLLDLYEASFELRWLQWTARLQTKMDDCFWDETRGGYFNSAAGDLAIVLRLKEEYDGAEPAPSSVAAMNLLRLAALLEAGTAPPPAPPAATNPIRTQDFRDRGTRCLDAFRTQWSGSPQALPQMLCALESALEPPRHIVLAGERDAPDFRALAAVAQERLGPRRAIIALPGKPGDESGASDDRRWWVERAPWMANMEPHDGRATAFVCEQFTCQAPVTSPEDLRPLLTR